MAYVSASLEWELQALSYPAGILSEVGVCPTGSCELRVLGPLRWS